jgi:hypothetical protein
VHTAQVPTFLRELKRILVDIRHKAKTRQEKRAV